MRFLNFGVLFVVAVLAGCSAADEQPGPTANATSAPTGTPTGAPAVSEAPVILPSSCDALYSEEARTLISPDGFLALNPAWMIESERKRDNAYGSFDDTLIGMLTQDPGLICDWAKASGGGEVFITTQARWADQAESERAGARIQELGWECSDDFGGTWCKTERENGGSLAGESHFFRDGLWVATNYVNVAPDGYTQMLVDRIFP